MVWFFFGLSFIFTFLGFISGFFFVRSLCQDHYHYNPFRLPWLLSMTLVQVLIGLGVASIVSPDVTSVYTYMLFGTAAVIMAAVAFKLYRRLHPLMLAPVLGLMTILSVLLLPFNVWESVSASGNLPARL